jgi:amino acid transporter
MKQQNFLFVDLISSIFLLILLIGNFLGLLYILDGSLPFSILVSMFIVICYYFVIEMLKRNKQLMYKNNFLHPSSVFGILFFVLSIISFYLMTHFINIEYNCKEQIKNEATDKIKLVENLVIEYKIRANKDIQNFESELKTKLSDYKSNPTNSLRNSLIKPPYNLNFTVVSNPNGINVNQVANAKVNPYQIQIDNTILNLDNTISTSNKKFLSVFDNWNRLSIGETYIKLNKYVEDNLKTINSKIAELPLDKSEIKIDYNKNQLPLNSPKKLNLKYPPNYLFPTLIIILIHIFILIPFFVWRIKIYDDKDKDNIDPLEIENVREI